MDRGQIVEEGPHQELVNRPDGYYARLTAETDQWWLDFVADDLDGNEVIEFTFTDGKPGKMSVNDILFHVLTHSSYHRGMIGKILSEARITVPRDILTAYLHRNR